MMHYYSSDFCTPSIYGNILKDRCPSIQGWEMYKYDDNQKSLEYVILTDDGYITTGKTNIDLESVTLEKFRTALIELHS